MTTVSRFTCDRCGVEILEDRTLIVAQCGPIRDRGRPGVDLCRGCCEAFLAFLEPGPTGAPATLGPSS